MHLLKSISVLFILFFAVNSFASDTFEFFPQKFTAHLEADHIWFVDNDSNEKTGPELYADETKAEFFTFIKKTINDAVAKNKKVIFQFNNTNSESHGQYDCIIPDS